MAYERRRDDWWVYDGNPDDSLNPADLDYFENTFVSLDSRITVVESESPEGVFSEVEKSENYEVQVSDNRVRLVATAAMVFAVPNPGELGDGFQCVIVNDSGSGITLVGQGEDVSLDDGDVATVMEVNGKQRVFKLPTTLISGAAATWSPSMLGPELVRWWDADDVVTLALNPTTNGVISWTEKGYYQDIATQGVEANRPILQSGEVRFSNGAHTLATPTVTRAYIEHTWFYCLFRINWTASVGATSGCLFAVNGNGGGDQRQPRMGYTASTQEVFCGWRNLGSQNEVSLDAAGDDVWHSFLARRAPEGVYASIDGGAETFLSCNPAMPSNSGLNGIIGDAANDLDFGLDQVILGQGQISAANIDRLHGWGMWKRGVQANLPALHAYADDAPTPVEPYVEPPDGESDPTMDWPSIDWDETNRGDALDLSGLTLDFEEDFDDELGITDAVTGAGPLYAPGRPDTSLAKFRTPSGPNSTPDAYSAAASILTITMQKPVGLTNWFSGHMQTVNTFGEGLTWNYGYFECKMACEGPVAWPAFWLYTQNRHKSTSATTAELDVVEVYGTDPNHHHMTVHRHRAERIQPGHLSYGGVLARRGDISRMDDGGANAAIWGITDFFDDEFHTYGIMVTPDFIITYLDGFELGRIETYTEAHLPKFMLVTLAMEDAFITQAVSPTTLRVDYLRAYVFGGEAVTGFGEGGFGEGGFGE